jgi:hypothetical protein
MITLPSEFAPVRDTHILIPLDITDLSIPELLRAFLHGVLPEDETMFTEQPWGFEVLGKENMKW